MQGWIRQAYIVFVRPKSYLDNGICHISLKSTREQREHVIRYDGHFRHKYENTKAKY